MKYKYSTVFPPSYTKKFIRRPMVEIEIFGSKGKIKQLALIDSGADYSLFNFDIAELVGIDLKNAKQEAFFDLHRIKFERDHGAFEINPVGK